MLLERLPKEIKERTHASLVGRQQQVSRTFYVIASPAFIELPEWYAEWFPAPDALLSKERPWLILPPDPAVDERFADHVTQVCMAAFDVGTVNELISKGFQLRENHNHLVLIADATDSDALQRLQQAKELFAAAAETLLNQACPFFISAIVLLKKIAKNEQAIEIKKAQNEAELQHWLAKEVDRAFLIDLNNNGYSIKENRDLVFLVGQLVHFLTQAAVQKGAGEFGEWMRRGSSSEGQCSGFSAMSLSVPIEQILENILLAKGADLLDSRLLGGYSEERLAGYLLAWKNHTHTNSLNSLTEYLLSHCEPKLLTPLGDDDKALTEIWSIENSADVMQQVDQADASVYSLTVENKRILSAFSEMLELDYAYALASCLDAIVATEKGGFAMAEAFLLAAREHVVEMIPEEIAPPLYRDVAPILASLRSKVEKGPRLFPLLIRAGLFALPVVIAAIYDFQWYYAAFALLFALAPLLQWHAYNDLVGGKVVRVWEALRNKWQVCMENVGLHVAAAALNGYLSTIDEQTDRLCKARQRSESLIAVFRESAAHAVEDASAFWHYVMRAADDYADAFARLETDTPAIEAQFLTQVKMANLIDRLASAGTGQPSTAEWRLLEGAAMLYLPAAGRLMDINILALLKNKPEKFVTFFAMLQQTGSPFLQLLPGQAKTNISSVWEVSQDMPEVTQDVLKSKTDGIAHSALIFSGNPFRIAFYTFMDGVPMNAVKWRA